MNTRKKEGLNFIRKMYHNNPFTFKKYKQLKIQYLVNNNQWEMIKIIKKIFNKISHNRTLLENYIYFINRFFENIITYNDIDRSKELNELNEKLMIVLKDNVTSLNSLLNLEKYRPLNIQYLINNDQWEIITKIKIFFDIIETLNNSILFEKYVYITNYYMTRDEVLNSNLTYFVNKLEKIYYNKFITEDIKNKAMNNCIKNEIYIQLDIDTYYNNYRQGSPGINQINIIFDLIYHDTMLLEKYIYMVKKLINLYVKYNKDQLYELHDYFENMPANNEYTSIMEYINNYHHQYQINSLYSICGRWDNNSIKIYNETNISNLKNIYYEKVIFDQLFMKTSSKLFNIIYRKEPFSNGGFNTVHHAHYRSYCNDKSPKIIVRVSRYEIPEFIEPTTEENDQKINEILKNNEKINEIVQSVKNSLLFMLHGIGPNVFNYGIRHNKLVYVLEKYDHDLRDYLKKNAPNLIIWQQILKQIDHIITVIVDKLNLFCIDIKPNNTLIRIDSSSNNVKIVFIDADSDLCPTNNCINNNDKKIHKHLLLLMYNMHFSHFDNYKNEKIIKFTADDILMVNNYIVRHHLIKCMELYIATTHHYFHKINREKKVGEKMYTSGNYYIQFNRFFWVNKQN